MLRGKVAKWRFERQLAALSADENAAFRSYAAADWPKLETPAHQVPFLALDFELDGLRKESHLLQAGWVPFNGRAIGMADAISLDIRSYATLDAEAVTIHGIGEQRAAKGAPVSEALLTLISVLTGRVMVAHAAGIEQSALQRACAKLFDVHIPVRLVCTLALERYLNPNLVGREAYRLASCRKRYGLPDYKAHDALTDAIAAAELFQAQLTRLPADTTLAQLEHR